MSKSIFALALLSFVLFGCKWDDDHDSPSNELSWRAHLVVGGGSSPKISPDGSKLLFMRDGEGLFLLDQGIETRVSPPDVTARPDYSWDVAGSNEFVYSIPGEPGQDASIFVRKSNGETIQVWDRGSDPLYNSAENFVICAGPAVSDSESGIWKIDLADLGRTRLTEMGVAPQVGFEGELLLYLVNDPISVGDRLTARDMNSLSLLSRLEHVVSFQSRLNMSIVLAELAVDPTGVASIPAIVTTAALEPPPVNVIAQPATNGVLLDDGILYSKIAGDTLAGLYLFLNDAVTLISDSLYSASANSYNRIYAVGDAGIYQLIRN
jgi:hypothetical protein